MAVPKNGKKKKSLLKPNKHMLLVEKDALKELELDLQQYEAEIEQGVSGAGSLDRMNKIKKAIRKMKKLKS